MKLKIQGLQVSRSAFNGTGSRLASDWLAPTQFPSQYVLWFLIKCDCLSALQCLYGCYVHSSIVPTFHRRCYWLLQVPHRHRHTHNSEAGDA